MTQFLSISFRCEAAKFDALEAQLIAAGANSISLRNADSRQTERDVLGIWEHSLVSAWLPLDASLNDLRSALMSTNCSDIQFDFIDSNALLASAEPSQRTLNIGPFEISDGASEVSGDRLPIRISPALAFGTGSHATTAMCLEWLGALDLQDRSVLDLGCGSGILAIAAKKRGAAYVVAVDNDPVALDTAQANAARNDVEVDFKSGLQDGESFDVICANIFANTLIELAPSIENALAADGALALSGLLPDQIESVASAFNRTCFEDPRIQDGWVLLTSCSKQTAERRER